jgi:polysaccharide biosynthesis/export protein
MLKQITIYLVFSILLFSCVSKRKAVYFNEIQSKDIESKLEIYEHVIQKNDLLSITVSSLNPEASQIFNTPNSATTATSTISGNLTQAAGYLVDTDGYIQFPVLGNIKAEGMTKTQLKETIYKQLVDKKLLLDPIVTIRYLNFKISVLGEVDNPSVLTIANEKISLLEALGLAGDITIYGKRDNVLLIREEGGKKIIRRINLNTEELFTSPYYYLKSNDVIYVEPNKSKIASTRQISHWFPAIVSGVSFMIVVVDRLLR